LVYCAIMYNVRKIALSYTEVLAYIDESTRECIKNSIMFKFDVYNDYENDRYIVILRLL